jgi:hypothetical protein
MLSTLAGGGEMRSGRIFTDASGVPYFRDAGNLMFSLNDIERGDNVLVIASTYNDALSDLDDGRLSGVVFTQMAWVFDGGRSSPVSVGGLREYLSGLTDGKNTVSQIKDSSYVKGWVLTGEPGGADWRQTNAAYEPGEIAGLWPIRDTGKELPDGGSV